MSHYANSQEFAATLRSGKRPDGSEVSSVMPFASFKNLNNDEIEAAYRFLKDLPARKTGNR